MALILLVLILAILLGGLGFALHALWWIAIIVAIAWLLGFVIRVGEGRRWYRWLGYLERGRRAAVVSRRLVPVCAPSLP